MTLRFYEMFSHSISYVKDTFLLRIIRFCMFQQQEMKESLDFYTRCVFAMRFDYKKPHACTIKTRGDMAFRIYVNFYIIYHTWC